LWDKALISHDAGEIWHLLDQKNSNTFIDENKFGLQNADLNRYTTLILAMEITVVSR
jgi:hypothetical protein